MTQKTATPGLRQFLNQIGTRARSTSKFPRRSLGWLADLVAGANLSIRAKILTSLCVVIFLMGATNVVSMLQVWSCARPGAAGLWRLWRAVLRNVVYAPVGEVAADTLSQVLGGGVAARISGQAAQGLGTGLLIGRLGLEAIRACRPLPFTGREATQPSLKVLGEGMLQLLKGSLTKPGPS